MLKTSNTTTTVETNFTVNGKSYKSIDEMDSATRKIIEDANQQLTSAFIKPNIMQPTITEKTIPAPPAITPEVSFSKKYLWIMIALLIIIFLISFSR